MSQLDLQKAFEPRYGEAVVLSPLVTRVVARNPSPYTFHGTSSYVVGSGSVFVVDPGPDLAEHRAALIEAVAGRAVAAILVTHAHRDHVGGAAELAQALGAPVLAAQPRRPAGDHGLDGGRAPAFAPDRILADGEQLALEGCNLQAIATPGHASDHMVFALGEEGTLFSGDHVMGWSTTIVAPPDGHMGSYLQSLRRLIARPERLYYPGHGGEIANGSGFARALLGHRLGREEAIAARVAAGTRRVSELVADLYQGLAAALVPAAELSVLAHLEHLVEQGRISADPHVAADARFAAV